MTNTPTAEERIVAFRPLIKSRARSWHRGWLAKQATLDELESVACEAVWMASQSYRDDQGTTFTTYAFRVINRALGHAAKKARAVKRQGITASMSENDAGDDPFVLVSRGAAPDHRLRSLELRQAVRDAVDALEPKLKEIIERRYWRNETLHHIGESWGLSRERIRQLEGEAFKFLRPRLAIVWIGMPQEAA